MAGARSVRIACLRHLPDTPKTCPPLGSEDIVVLDEAAKVNELPAGVDRVDIGLLQAHPRKDALHVPVDSPVLRRNHLGDIHRRIPVRIVDRLG